MTSAPGFQDEGFDVLVVERRRILRAENLRPPEYFPEVGIEGAINHAAQEGVALALALVDVVPIVLALLVGIRPFGPVAGGANQHLVDEVSQNVLHGKQVRSSACAVVELLLREWGWREWQIMAHPMCQVLFDLLKTPKRHLAHPMCQVPFDL